MMLAHLQAWFRYFLPISPHLETTQQRERYRKGSLLAVVLLVNFSAFLSLVFVYALTGLLLSAFYLLLALGIALLTLWLNRHGYLEIAALIYLMLILICIVGFTILAHLQNVGVLWIIFLIIPTLLAGIFLQSWLPWVFGALDCSIVTIIWMFSQRLPWSGLSNVPTVYLIHIYFLLLLIALIAALYAWSIERAVRQADRAEELELLNARFKEANEELHILQGDLLANNTALQGANARLESLATTDPLTGLPNHRALIQLLDGVWEEALRHERPFAVLFFDIDHFKAINDTYGHSSGDDILQAFADVVQQSLRQIDVIGRWGGEEFVAVLPEIEEVPALEIAERVRHVVASTIFAVGAGIRLTCSIGVACYQQNSYNQKELLEAADRAMYFAKHAGRNQVRMANAVVLPLIATATQAASMKDMTVNVDALVALLEARDAYTGEHTQEVGTLMEEVAQAMGCATCESQYIGLAGRLHDMGKVAIPDTILHKPSKLTSEEWAVMRTHPQVGADLIARFSGLHVLTAIIRSHHERWDGHGYPDGLVGEAIPIGGRIAAVVDAYNAMTTNRPYLSARTSEAAQGELLTCAGSQFDPQVVAAFIRLLSAKQDTARAA